MQLEPKNQCPLNNFEPCRKLDCAWFLKIAGTHPNTGKELEEWGCSVSWMPVLLLDNSLQQRQTGAAVESFRNEMVRSNEVSQRILLSAAELKSQKLLGD